VLLGAAEYRAMIARVRSRLTYANVIASLALFLAMGGTGYALTLPKNSVGAKQLKRNAVSSKKVKNGSLLGKDFKAGQLPAGSQGPAGAPGPAGKQGAPGSAAGYASVRGDGLFYNAVAKNVTSANLTHTAGTGIYCFQNLPFTHRSALATPNGFLTGELDTVVNVNINFSGVECPGSFTTPTTRVVTWDASAGAAADRSFTIWFED
jgi:hypothetical protein